MFRLTIVLLTAANVFMILYAPQPLLPFFAGHFGVTDPTAGLIISAMIFSLALSSIILAPLSDRWDRKHVVLISAVGLVVPNAALFFTDSFAVLVFWRFVQGFFVPGIIAILPAYLSEEFPVNKRGRVLGAYISVTVIGGFVGRLVAGPITSYISWEAVFGLIAVFSAVIAVLVWRFLPPSSRQSGHGRGDFFRHLKNPAMVGTFLIGFMQFFAFIGFFTFLSFYASRPPFHLNLIALSYVYGTFLFGVVSAFAAGALSDRIGRRPALAVGHLFGLAGVTLTLWPTLSALLIGASLLALGNFAAQSAATAYINDIAVTSKGAAISTYQFTYYLGGSLGGWLPGYLWKAQAWPGVVGSLAAALILALLFNWVLAGRVPGGEGGRSERHTSCGQSIK